jgi:acyl-coenzyme A thioesterase PaaI-like protein
VTVSNRLTEQLARLERLPTFAQPWIRNRILGRAVPFTGTARLRYELLSPQQVVIAIVNRRRVQNHIKGVHAAAVALLAETASGFVVGMNLPDQAVPLIKTMTIDFQRRASGDMRAVATLTDEQIHTLRTLPKGEIAVNVVVSDESGQHPVACVMVWAWIPRKKRP